MNQVQIDDIHRSLPSCWNELTAKQLLFVSEMFSKDLTVVDFKVASLFDFLSIKLKVFKRINAEDAFYLCKTLDFILQEVTLTRNLIPVIKRRLSKFYGPGDGLLNCTFGEFTQAHTRFEQYVETQSLSALDELVAILYRPRKFGWVIRKHFMDCLDQRIRFKERTFKRRIRKMGKVDKLIKYSVFLFFSGCLNSLPKQFPNVYRKKEDSVSSSMNGWISLIISLANSKTDNQSIDLVVNSNLYNVFLGLEYKSIEYFNYLDKVNRK